MPGPTEPRLAERLRRLEALDPLLVTLASTLDIRQVFRQVAAVTKEAVPHDFLALGRYDDELRTAKVYALTHDAPSEPTINYLSDANRERIHLGIAIARDIAPHDEPRLIRALLRQPGSDEEAWIDADVDPTMKGVILGHGIRSILFVPVKVDGKVVAALFFHSRTPAAYGEDDAYVAKLVGECVALALSHEKLAEEARLAAEARERAAALEVRVRRLTEELESRGGPHRQVGVSKKWRDVLSQATKVAATETTVLLTGESGTGKEVVARFLHGASPRKDGPFVALNCAALPEQLLESELFGHEKGAFTGALASRPGKIEQAAGGVLFLDEVGEMTLPVQAKFLRVLQEREFQRLGGTATKKADVRIVAATNRDLAKAIGLGQFREDLYYRLHVFEIRLPPLRERPEDIVALLDHFLTELGSAVGRPAAGVSVEAKKKIVAYPWPGNVRELRNAVERAVILAEGGLIRSEHLPIPLGKPAPASEAPAAPTTLPPEGVDLESVERALVEQALERAGRNKSQAARLLGLTRAQLYNRLERWRIS